MNHLTELSNFGKHFLPEKIPLVFSPSFFEFIKTRKVIKQDQSFKQPRISEQSQNSEQPHRKYSSSQACKFFGSLDKIYRVAGYHPLSSGEYYIKELGYRVDYFNPKLKVIIEWDEEYHFYNDVLRDEDIIRQKRIQAFYPTFTFLRVREKRFFEPQYIKRILDIFSNIVKLH